MSSPANAELPPITPAGRRSSVIVDSVKRFKRRLSHSPARHDCEGHKVPRHQLPFRDALIRNFVRRSSSKESSPDDIGFLEETRPIPRSSVKLEPQEGLREVKGSYGTSAKSTPDPNCPYLYGDDLYGEPDEIDAESSLELAVAPTTNDDGPSSMDQRIYEMRGSRRHQELTDMELPSSSPPPTDHDVKGLTVELDQMEQANVPSRSKPHNNARQLRLQTETSNLGEKIEGSVKETSVSPEDGEAGRSAGGRARSCGKYPSKKARRAQKTPARRTRATGHLRRDDNDSNGDDSDDGGHSDGEERTPSRSPTHVCPWKGCTRCGNRRWELARLKERIRRAHLKPWKCPHCHYRQGDIHQITRHQDKKHGRTDPAHQADDLLAVEKHNRLNRRNLGYEAIREICNAETLEELHGLEGHGSVSPSVIKKENNSETSSLHNPLEMEVETNADDDADAEGETDPDIPMDTTFGSTSTNPSPASITVQARNKLPESQVEEVINNVQRLLSNYTIPDQLRILQGAVSAVECGHPQFAEQPPWNSVGAQSGALPLAPVPLGFPGPSSDPGLTATYTATVDLRKSFSSLHTFDQEEAQGRRCHVQNSSTEVSPMLHDDMDVDGEVQPGGYSLFAAPGQSYPEPEQNNKQSAPPTAFDDEYELLWANRGLQSKSPSWGSEFN